MLFLYRQVLAKEIGFVSGVVRAKRPQRFPVVLTRQEGRSILGLLDGTERMIATLLYGAGLRLLECMRLRVKDIDFTRNQIVVRSGTGNTDRLTMLPAVVKEPLAQHLTCVRRQHQRDLERGLGHVVLPNALQRKYPNADTEWAWQWIFPASKYYLDRLTGKRYRHHLHESVICHSFRHSFATHLL